MHDVITLVLGGGQGTRLYPLTKYRSKPAVPVAGKYRLIDVPLSNCINSGLDRCYVLTQFNSVSLHRHIRSTYVFDVFGGGFVEILAAQQTLDNADWYQGTADAVRQNLRYLEQPGIRYVLVLSGDQLYRMDYRRMLFTHQNSRHDFRRPGRFFGGRGLGDHAVGRRRPRRRISRETKDPGGTGTRPHRSGLDRPAGDRQPRPRLPGEHGHLPVQPRHADRPAAED
jgi:CTP:molybdopterin cytidylyltransferase MocA